MEKRMELQETKHYSIFKYFPYNREVDERSVEALKKNIMEIGLICPIVVTSDLYIIDGQHRLKALQELEMVVDYVINSNITSTAIIEANNTQRGWTTMNFIKSYAKKGKADYIILLELIEEYDDFNPSSVYECFNAEPKHTTKLIRSGEYRVNRNKGAEIFDSCSQMEESIRHKAFGVKFVRAMRTIINRNPNFSIDHLLRKSKKRRLNIYDDAASNIEEIIEIYNDRAKKEYRIN